jgi:hypothetical protein
MSRGLYEWLFLIVFYMLSNIAIKYFFKLDNKKIFDVFFWSYLLGNISQVILQFIRGR